MVHKAQYRNHVWSYDFLEDRTQNGRRLGILAVIDEFTRECLALLVDRSITSDKVVGLLDWLFLAYGVPQHLRSDNGPELIARKVQDWRDEYNQYRPHSALGYLTLTALAAQHSLIPLPDHQVRVRV